MSLSQPHPEVVVVGSVNLDHVASVESLPAPGETVSARSYAEFCGGKGGNQAIAAARLGRRVSFVGRIGDDDAGTQIRSALAAEGVGVEQLKTLGAESTGRAFVIVDSTAENSIVVVGGANARLERAHVDQASVSLQQAAVVLAQLEVPLEAVRAAAEYSRGVFVFNPAPARPLDRELLDMVDVLVVNEGEFLVVSGQPVCEDLHVMTVRLRTSDLPKVVIVTLGSRGALVWGDDVLTLVDAPLVNVIDTTGAGDTFMGALADALAREQPLLSAARWAVAAASISTTSAGATTGMPDRAAVIELCGELEIPPIATTTSSTARLSAHQQSRAARN